MFEIIVGILSDLFFSFIGIFFHETSKYKPLSRQIKDDLSAMGARNVKMKQKSCFDAGSTGF